MSKNNLIQICVVAFVKLNQRFDREKLFQLLKILLVEHLSRSKLTFWTTFFWFEISVQPNLMHCSRCCQSKYYWVYRSEAEGRMKRSLIGNRIQTGSSDFVSHDHEYLNRSEIITHSSEECVVQTCRWNSSVWNPLKLRDSSTQSSSSQWSHQKTSQNIHSR